MNQLTKENLTKFFERPGINKNGICKEADVSPQLLNRVLAGGYNNGGQWIPYQITEKLTEKLLPVLLKYGFEPGD